MSKLSDFINDSNRQDSGWLDSVFSMIRHAFAAKGNQLVNAIVEHASGIDESEFGDDTPATADFHKALLLDVTHPDVLKHVPQDTLVSVAMAISDEYKRREEEAPTTQLQLPLDTRAPIGPTDV